MQLLRAKLLLPALLKSILKNYILGSSKVLRMEFSTSVKIGLKVENSFLNWKLFATEINSAFSGNPLSHCVQNVT